MIIAAFAFGLFLVGVSTAFQMLERRTRDARFQGLTLRPNCLLTRFPIVFISGPRTVFRLFDHWNSIPLYLREHGYEVYVVEPAGRTVGERALSVTSAVEDLGRCHLIADGSLEKDLSEIAALRLDDIASITCVKSLDRERFVRARGGVSLHELKPSSVEVFEVNGTPVGGAASLARLVLLAAHNFLIKRRTHFVHPFETAELSRRGFSSEQRFLDLAISLAERDLIGSD